MERYHHCGPAWPQGPFPMDCKPPAVVEGSFPDTTASQFSEPKASSSAAFQESPDTCRVQESQADKSPVKKPKSRTTFSKEQLRLLRRDFEACRYITRERGYQLAQLLGLNYKQVKTWFQNQRLKAKKSQTVPVCTSHVRDPRLSQLKPAIGPQGLSLPASFHVDPVNNRLENNSGWSNWVSKDWLQNYGEVASPYQMVLQPPYPSSPLEAPVRHTGWNYPIGPQSSSPPCSPATMQGYLPPLNTSVQLRLSSSDGSEVSSASAPSPNGSGVPWDQSYPLMGPVLSAP